MYINIITQLYQLSRETRLKTMIKSQKYGVYTNKHSCYLLQYHLVLVTKYRHSVITGELKDALYEYTRNYFKQQDLVLLELNGEADHIHILFEAPPQICLSKLINAYKSASSRRMRQLFENELKQYYWKPYFWSLSYFVCTVSERSTEAVQRYIQNQKG